MRLFKYKAFSLHAVKMLVEDELYLAHAKSELNDPVDCALIVDGQSCPLNATVCALSKTHTSPLMWSQYADGHKGVCFELDYQGIKEVVARVNSKLADSIQFGPVKYLEPVPYKSELEKHVTPLEFGGQVVDYDKVVMLKTTPFEHEKEVRVVTKSLRLRSTLKVPGLVKGVYVGINMKAGDRKFLERLVGMVSASSAREVRAYEAVALTNKYRLRFRRLNWD